MRKNGPNRSGEKMNLVLLNILKKKGILCNTSCKHHLDGKCNKNIEEVDLIDTPDMFLCLSCE